MRRLHDDPDAERADLLAQGLGDLTREAFLDLEAIFFELERFKNERSWYNLNLPR